MKSKKNNANYTSDNLKRIAITWIFVIPAAIGIGLFYFYPMVRAFILSFQSGPNLDFVGFKNYTRLLTDPTYLKSVSNTILFFIVQVPLMLILSLVFSELLNQQKLKFKVFFRMAIFLPAITSLVAYSVVFKYIFSLDGPINQLLMNMSVISSPILWLGDSFWSKLLIILAITWRWTGYNMIFFLAGRQNIDDSIYEAAKIDGASETQQFFGITIPLLKPIILFTSITSTIGTLQLFDEPVNLTKGGPGNATTTISQYIYNLSFEYTPDFGYAAAVSFTIVIMVVILSIIQFKLAGDDNE